MIHKYIIKIFLLHIAFSVLTAQEIKISGQVLDQNSGLPVAGVNIVGKESGTTTDQTGKFKITGKKGEFLEFSHIAYKTVKLPVQNELLVSLEKSVLRGADVVVEASRAVYGVTPVSFSNLTAAEIKARFTVEDVPMVLASEPGVWAYSESGNGTGYSYVSIRGFDQSRIGVMLDNVPLNDNESHQVYWVDHGDILSSAKEVQIQRGIGNSMYGSSAFGGTINIKTDLTSSQKEFAVLYGKGSFNTDKFQINYKSGKSLGQKLNFVARASQIRSNGYRQGHKSRQKSFFLGVQHNGQNITNQFRILIGFENTKMSWDGVAFENIDNRKNRKLINMDDLFTDNFLQQIYSLNTIINLNNDLYFRNVSYLVLGSGYYQIKKLGRDYYSYNLDQDDRYTDNQEISLKTDLLQRKWIENNYYGIIPTLTWNINSIRFDIGAEARFYTGDHFGEVKDFSAPDLINNLGNEWYRYYHYTGKKNTFTGFAHLAWSPSDAPFVIMADLQTQNHDWKLDQDVIVHGEGHKLQAKWNFINPRVGMVVHMADSMFWFVNYGKAQKEPADNQIIDADDIWSEPIMAAAEVITDWEMGINFTFIKGQGSINYYRINYLNEQLKNIDVDQAGEYDYYAADSTIHQGVEWEFSHIFSPRLKLESNGALIMNNYTNGNSLPNIPASLFNLFLNYNFRSNLSLLLHYKTIGQIYIDDENKEEAVITPYSLMNIGAKYEWHNLEVTLKINNLFDRLYSTYGYGYEYNGFQSYYWPGATRNVYLSFRYKL